MVRSDRIAGSTAVVLPDAEPMQAVFDEGTFEMREQIRDSVYQVEIRF